MAKAPKTPAMRVNPAAVDFPEPEPRVIPKPPAKAKVKGGLAVVATARGFYDKLREPGTGFIIRDAEAFSENWMRWYEGKGDVDPNAPTEAELAGKTSSIQMPEGSHGMIEGFETEPWVDPGEPLKPEAAQKK